MNIVAVVIFQIKSSAENEKKLNPDFLQSSYTKRKRTQTSPSVFNPSPFFAGHWTFHAKQITRKNFKNGANRLIHSKIDTKRILKIIKSVI